MDINIEKLERMLTGNDSFLVDLRLKRGINYPKTRAFIEELNELEIISRGQILIPKRLAYLLIEVNPAIMSSLDLYPVKEKEAIIQLMVEIDEAILSLFSS